MLERCGAAVQGRGEASRAPTGPASPPRVLRRPVPKAAYPPFRATFFHDPAVNPALRGAGGEPDRLAAVRDSRRLWSSTGPSISARLPKTAVSPGTAFRNACLSADQLYSSSRDSLGYEAHREPCSCGGSRPPCLQLTRPLAGSLRGTSLCSATKRFQSVRYACINASWSGG